MSTIRRVMLPDDLREGVTLPQTVALTDDPAYAELYVPPYMGPTSDLELMAAMPQLQVCQLLTAGYETALDHLPDGVTLCNAAGVHDSSTAELAIGLMIASLRRIDDFARAMPQGEWLYGRYDALADRKVLIIGRGGVGSAIARRLQAFEVDVAAVGRSGYLDGMLPWADIVVLAVPLDDSTRGMVDAGFLSAMNDGALLVNVARGPVVDTDALLAEVSSGRLRAALDVTDPEPLPPGHPLWTAPGVLISPHVGGNTSAFLPRARRLVQKQLEQWATGRPLINVVRPG